MTKLQVGIVGGTGYTAHELLKILLRHPDVNVAFITSESKTGTSVADYFPDLPPDNFLNFKEIDSQNFDSVDVVFLCTPHGESQKIVPQILGAGTKVIDLSGDYRLRTPDSYKNWYKMPHADSPHLGNAVYGLPEIYREQIRQAALVANPGCYPTGALLSLIPLAKSGAIRPEKIFIDAKSGVSGAGKKLTQLAHFVEANENLTPYNAGHTHRHIGEIEQELQTAFNRNIPVVFVPQLVPLNRGILETIYIDRPAVKNQQQILEILKDFYRKEPFVRILDDKLPAIQMAAGTNFCFIGAVYDRETDVLIVVNSFDNLLKGASGKAVQNMNILFKLNETTALI